MALLNSFFEANTLNDFLKAGDDMYTREAIEALSEFFTGTTPSLREVCDTTIDYCNANKPQLNYTVYLMTAPNGKQYVGQTNNLDVRTRAYKRNDGSNAHWTRALKKHGFENFKIEHYDIPTVCADIVEKFAILWYDLMNIDKGYNKTSGGKNGWMVSECSRAQMSAKKRGVPLSAKNKEAIKASWTPERKAAATGENSYFWGKKRPKHSEKMSGKNNPMFGKFGKEHNAFGKKRLDISGINSKKLGDKNPCARPVVVNGILYSYIGGASKIEFPDKNEGYVSTFIKNNKKSLKMFKVSKEFYADCMRKNIVENITREMHESYYYFI